MIRFVAALCAVTWLPLFASAASSATAESHTYMTGGGTVDVRVETETDGVRHVETVHRNVPTDGIHIEIATSTANSDARTSVRIGPAIRPADVRPSATTTHWRNASSTSATTTIPRGVRSLTGLRTILKHMFDWLRGL